LRQRIRITGPADKDTERFGHLFIQPPIPRRSAKAAGLGFPAIMLDQFNHALETACFAARSLPPASGPSIPRQSLEFFSFPRGMSAILAMVICGVWNSQLRRFQIRKVENR